MEAESGVSWLVGWMWGGSLIDGQGHLTCALLEVSFVGKDSRCIDWLLAKFTMGVKRTKVGGRAWRVKFRLFYVGQKPSANEP